MTSYLSPQTRRTILAAQKDCIFPREASTLTEKLDFIVDDWRLIHEAADGALKRKSTPTVQSECSLCGGNNGAHVKGCIYRELDILPDIYRRRRHD